MKRALVALIVVGVAGATVHAQGRTGSGSAGQQAMEEAGKAYDSDDFATAEQKYKDAIGLDASIDEAYWKLATIYYKNKQYPKAVEILRRAPDKTNLGVKEQLGLSLYKSSNPPPPEAVKLLEEVVAAKPAAFLAQLQLGQHFLKSDPKKSAAAFENFLANRPPNLAAMDDQAKEKLGQAYLLGKDWDAAIRFYEGILKSKTNDLTAKLMLGTALTAKGHIDPKACSQAITLYERILGDANKQPSIWYNLGTCYLKNNRPADTQRQAELYIKARGGEAKGHVLLGDAHYYQNRHDKALQSYQTARSMDKNSTAIVAKIGLTDVKLKNYDSAIAGLEQAEGMAPGDVEILCALVEAYGAKKLKDKLNARAEKLASMSKDPKALGCAGLAYYTNGNDPRAATTYQSVLALEPNNGGAKSSLVKVLNRLGAASLEKNELSKAQAHLVEAEKLLPDELMTNRNLGLVLLMNKKYGDAEVVLQKALRKVPNDMVVNRLLARAMLGLAKRDKARDAYEKAAQTALRTRGVDLAGVYAELGPLYIEAQQLDQAITVLEQAVREAGPGALGQTAQRNMVIAYFERGRERLRDPKQTEGALEDIMKASQAPKGVLTAKETTAALCFEWAAALKAGKIPQAVDAIGKAKAGGGCQVKATWEKQGTAFLEGYTLYRDGANLANREKAAKLFAGLIPKAIGNNAEILKALLRSTFELLGYDFFQKGSEKLAENSLKSALKIQAKGREKLELEHNMAVIDLAAGRTGQAEKVFESLKGRVPEAQINLGIIKDRQGDGKGALQLYRAALAGGARSGKVREWIDVKQRIYGGAP